MSDAELTLSIEDEAARLGVVDGLVFRRLSASQWAHLGGFGRGRGWAGLVDVDATEEPLMAHVPPEPGALHRFDDLQVGRVIGPYYAAGGALVRVSNDVMVIFGNPSRSLSPAASRGALRRLAYRLEASVEDVTPAKRLADELEVLQAIRAITTVNAPDLAGTLQHIVAVVAESLSCELGLLRTGTGKLAVTSTWSGIDLDDPALSTALDILDDRAGDQTLCIQDADTEARDLPPPLDRQHGVRSLLAVRLPGPAGGVLVVAHTSAEPRGFTTLCRQLANQLTDAASVVAHTAALRDELRAMVDEQFHYARRDALTGLGNRLAWDEALVVAQEHVAAGHHITVITLDVDGLKHVNDSFGHEAGDRLLRNCAAVLQEYCRDGDVAVRLGGDEFALLLAGEDSLGRDRLTRLTARLGGVTSCAGTVAASVGAATALPGSSVADAVREADMAMYAAKRARRLRAPAIPGPTGQPPASTR
ncbi:MAG: sensor domain-containing diguanylate cyclase [Propionibacteriales bacterium]|nr:sensor domain-containing diguanylate cyclase [Propionibacteriales bacterium]